MRFLIDANLPPALALWLRERGQDADHVFDLFKPGELDRAIWRNAASDGRTIITKDTDFLHMALLDPDGPPSSSVAETSAFAAFNHGSRSAIRA